MAHIQLGNWRYMSTHHYCLPSIKVREFEGSKGECDELGSIYYVCRDGIRRDSA